MKTKTPHKHAEVIKAWADGHQIQSVGRGCTLWCDEDDPSWSDFYDYRVKPEREYPKTSLTNEELYKILTETKYCRIEDSLVDVANAAIKRHEEDKGTESGEMPATPRSSDFHQAYLRGFRAGILKALFILREKGNVDDHTLSLIDKEIGAAR